MPAALAFIPLVLGAATGIGSTLFGGGSSSSSDIQKAQQQQAQQDAAKQAAQDAAQRKQLLSKQVGNAQELTGGSLSDSSFAQEIANLAGLPGNMQDALRLLGGSSTSSEGSSGGSTPSSSLTPSSPSPASSSSPSLSSSNLSELIDHLFGNPPLGATA